MSIRAYDHWPEQYFAPEETPVTDNELRCHTCGNENPDWQWSNSCVPCRQEFADQVREEMR